MNTRNSVSLVSSEPLGLELVAEGLNVEDCGSVFLWCFGRWRQGRQQLLVL
jgi:hypothetical protein